MTSPEHTPAVADALEQIVPLERLAEAYGLLIEAITSMPDDYLDEHFDSLTSIEHGILTGVHDTITDQMIEIGMKWNDLPSDWEMEFDDPDERWIARALSLNWFGALAKRIYDTIKRLDGPDAETVVAEMEVEKRRHEEAIAAMKERYRTDSEARRLHAKFIKAFQ